MCRGLVGEICALHCDDESMASVHVVCLPTGLWDVEIGAICIPGIHSGKRLNMHLYIKCNYKELGPLTAKLALLLITIMKYGIYQFLLHKQLE